MNLILYTPNKDNILLNNLLEKYINIENILINEIIIFDKNNNINKQIIDKYKQKPDLIIINFNNNIPLVIKNFPKYPIYFNDILYITPICIQQINGFSNEINEKSLLINDILNRIFFVLGGILSDNNLNFKLNKINLNSGIKELLYQDYKKEWFINNIPSWMSTYIKPNNAGWFSKYNKMAIDYVFDNYDIKNVAELGSYFGLSSHYIANKNTTLYCFDEFKNIALTDYIIQNITPIDIKYFFKYIKFECFHSKLSTFSNVYSVKYNCYDSVEFLFNNKINIDLFYIDFCKKDNLLIKFVDNIFKYYPNAIIIGDDAKILSTSLKYFSRKYDYIFMNECYMCSFKTKLINKDKLIKNINIHKNKETCTDIHQIKKLKSKYKIYYISKYISKTIPPPINKIVKVIEFLKINPNEGCEYLIQNSNLFNFIAYNFSKNNIFYMDLYNKLNEIYKDHKHPNYLNLTSDDYFNYGSPNFH